MDAGSPTKRVAALSAAKKVKKQRFAEGKLVAADLEHWAGPLQRAGLLSCTDFSKADGAAEAAGDDAFAAPADADAARDKAYDLLELIEKKAKAGPERELPLAGPALVTEFRKVAKTLAGQDDAVKQLLEDLAVEHAKGGAAGSVGRPGGRKCGECRCLERRARGRGSRPAIGGPPERHRAHRGHRGMDCLLHSRCAWAWKDRCGPEGGSRRRSTLAGRRCTRRRRISRHTVPNRRQPHADAKREAGEQLVEDSVGPVGSAGGK